jgi:hypothetical protein
MALSDSDGHRQSALLVRLLAWVVLALMGASIVYTAWIALANFGRISV